MNHAKSKYSMALAIVAISVLALVGGLSLTAGASSGQSFNNVQVFIQTENSGILQYTATVQNSSGSFMQVENETYQYTVSAYNSSGYLVASSQTEYPAASFELPSGTFLFTANIQPQFSGGIEYAKASVSAIPIRYPGVAQYGYLVQQISSSTTLNIATKLTSDIGSTSASISVHYMNGTAASDVSVSASVIGGYWYGNGNLVMSNQTGSDGVATLVVPSAPVEISAWAWVPVYLPTSETTTQVNVGGQEVNVTVHWQPTYVGLAGSKLLIPPQTSASIVLSYQQPSYWVQPYGVSSSNASTGQVGSGTGAPNLEPNSVYQQSTTNVIQNQIPPVATDTTNKATQPSSTLQLLSVGVIAAIILAATGIALVIRKK